MNDIKEYLKRIASSMKREELEEKYCIASMREYSLTSVCNKKTLENQRLKEKAEFKVEVVKDEKGQPVGIRAARVNNNDVIIAPQDAGCMDWFDAMKYKIPSIAEWCAIYENKEAVNKLIKKMGWEPIKSWFYWSSSEYNNSYAWAQAFSDGDIEGGNKNNNYNVRLIIDIKI